MSAGGVTTDIYQQVRVPFYASRPQRGPLALLRARLDHLAHLLLVGHAEAGVLARAEHVLLVELGDPVRLVLAREILERGEVVTERVLCGGW